MVENKAIIRAKIGKLEKIKPKNVKDFEEMESRISKLLDLLR